MENGVQNGVVVTVGERRRAERIARGLSVAQLARLEGVSRQAIYLRERAVYKDQLVEGGNRGPTPKTLALVARIRDLAAQGLNRVEIAAEVGRTYELVSKLVSLHQIPVVRKLGSGQPRKCR